MDFIDQIQALATKIQKARDFIQTEEATKNAFVLPFIQALGYDVFNPLEVIPEFTADVGIKKGEKVDYAIFHDGKPIILFECKKCGWKLDRDCASQLYRYFSVTDARIGILTDGIIYQFYTDLEEKNKMDEKPFMEFNVLDIQEPLVPELKKLTKGAFNIEATLNAATELKYTKEIRRIMSEELNSPSEEMVRLFTSRVYTGRLTQAVKEQFTDIVKRALHQFIADRINERIKTALSGEDIQGTQEQKDGGDVSEPAAKSTPVDDGIVTTDEEREGFYIVKSIVREVVDPARVVFRDTQTYFSVLLDDNNRKPICRLHLNRAQKYLGLLDEQKNEERVPIDSLNDIYQHAEHLKKTVFRYLNGDVKVVNMPSQPIVPDPAPLPSGLTASVDSTSSN
jgi:hypothetical protein